MATSKSEKKAKSSPARASITFPADIYETLEAIARSKRVSVAWVVRDAAEKYVANQQTVLGRQR